MTLPTVSQKDRIDLWPGSIPEPLLTQHLPPTYRDQRKSKRILQGVSNNMLQPAKVKAKMV